MLERIRDIRSSERRVYLRVLDIFTMAADYRPSDKETTQFFRVIQNKLDQFLAFNDREVLQHSDSVSKKEAEEIAQHTFEDFAQRRRRLKEAEGERINIEVLQAIASKEKKGH